MNRFWNPISLALILLSLLWGAVPSFAQTANLVAFKASWTGVNAGLLDLTLIRHLLRGGLEPPRLFSKSVTRCDYGA